MPIRGFPNGVIACFTEPNSVGDIEDYNAPRNAPAKNPGAYLDLVQWHIDFFQYELAFPIITTAVTHPTIPGQNKYWGPSNQYYMNDPTYVSAISYRVPGQTIVTDHTLVNHNLGYAPLAFVAWENTMIMPGVTVQIESDGRTRFISLFATSSVLGIREVATSSSASLPAVSRSYKSLIFKATEAQGGRPLFGREGANVVLGRGKVDTSKSYLRRVGGAETPFDLDRGPTIDINSGRTRVVTGGNFLTEPGYAGGFTGPTYVAVGS